MIRRRRVSKEIVFSFDSFLDVVANVVGIIIRLILVAWVGARTYSAQKLVGLAESEPVVVPEVQKHTREASPELRAYRNDLERLRLELAEQWRRLQVDGKVPQVQQAQLASLRSELEQARTLDKNLQVQEQAIKTGLQRTHASMQDLRDRYQLLQQQMIVLKSTPALAKTHPYQTPISRKVEGEELHFECFQGKVSHVEMGLLVGDIKDRIPQHVEELRRSWQSRGETRQIGFYRLQYVLERDPELSDTIAGGNSPSGKDNFRYSLSRMVVQPLVLERGETLMETKQAQSSFRQIVDRLHPEHATLTFWVYPDSFPLFRELRDELYGKGFVVAGRPLPAGVPIASSRDGSHSRGQ